VAELKVDPETASMKVLELSDCGNRISVKNGFNYSYDVLFAEGDILSTDSQLLCDVIDRRKCLVVVSQTVNMIYGRKIEHYFSSRLTDEAFRILPLPISENIKNMDTVMRICEEGKRFGLDRKSLFVAIGGGVLMDTVGLASSIYMRKLNFVRVPTTLVGQVDAGIGLKTGVDFAGTKNFIGSFHPPVCVLNDFKFLHTLDTEEIRNGLAEIIKIAIVSDPELFSALENNCKRIIGCYRIGSDTALTKWISVTAAKRMLEQLQANPYETELERLVDFGHTFSPFIEMHTRHGIRHGRAVAIDIAISTEIACLLGRIDIKSHDRIFSMLDGLDFNLHDEKVFDEERMWQSLDSIALRRGGKLNLVIPTGIGKGDFLRRGEELDRGILRQALENISSFSKESF
jgi:3-dehydroquinate synthetase